jgi:FAD/FMN-containing dehydrogenase
MNPPEGFMMRRVDAESVETLERAVGAGNVLADPEMTVGYGTAWAARDGVVPAAVVRPRDAAETSEVLRICAAGGQAVVLQGGNTGMVRGGVPASGDEVVLSTQRMDSIGEIDAESLQVVVGAGVTLEALQERLAGQGLELPVDLASRSQASIGGMAATNAGGSRAFRHGTMRHHVIGVEAVLADGSVIERLGGVMKDATGYDWPSVLVGSEGTLALITRVRLRLRRAERSRAAALIPVDSIGGGLALAVALRDRGCGLEAAEFVMPGALGLVCEELGLRPPFGGTDGRTVVLVECRAHEGAFEALIGSLRDLAVSADTAIADGGDADRLWRYREGLGEALTRPGAAARAAGRRARGAGTGGVRRGRRERPSLPLRPPSRRQRAREPRGGRRGTPTRGRTGGARVRPRPRRQHRGRAWDRAGEGRLARHRSLRRRHRRDARGEGRPRPHWLTRPRRPPATRLMGRKCAISWLFGPSTWKGRGSLAVRSSFG